MFDDSRASAIPVRSSDAAIQPTRREVHVVPHPSGWAVRLARASRSSSVHLTRGFAIEAGRKLAQRERVDLVVYGDDGLVQLRIGYGDDASAPNRRWRLARRRPGMRSAVHAAVHPGVPPGHGVPGESTVCDLLHVRLPYDRWCLRAARRTTAEAVERLCTPALLDDVLSVTTELVLHVTVRTRAECELSLHRAGDELLVVVREAEPRCGVTSRRADVGQLGRGLGTVHGIAADHGVERTQNGMCVWARFKLNLEAARS